MGELLVPAPVVTEICYFLSTAGKVRLLDWLRKLPRKVLDLPVYAYPEVSEILARYAQLDLDFTDAAMVWFAEDTGCREILTVTFATSAHSAWRSGSASSWWSGSNAEAFISIAGAGPTSLLRAVSA